MELLAQLRKNVWLMFGLMIATGFVAYGVTFTPPMAGMMNGTAADIMRTVGLSLAIAGIVSLPYNLLAARLSAQLVGTEMAELRAQFDEGLGKSISTLSAVRVVLDAGAVAGFRSSFDDEVDRAVADAIQQAPFSDSKHVRILEILYPAFLRRGRQSRTLLDQLLTRDVIHAEIVLLGPTTEAFRRRAQLDRDPHDFPLAIYFQETLDAIRPHLLNGRVSLYLTDYHPVARICATDAAAFWQPYHLGRRPAPQDPERGVGAMPIMLKAQRGSPLYELSILQFQYAKRMAEQSDGKVAAEQLQELVERVKRINI